MGSLLTLVCIVVLFGLTAGKVFMTAPEDATAAAVPSPTPEVENAPTFRSYRGVGIRVPAAQVTEKLGAPTQRSKAGDYYAISATESVQISYDAEQLVRSISINLTGDLRTAPTPKAVVGTDIKKDADGLMSKMVSFPKDGYWVSYTRTSGKDATVIITLQKLAQ